MGAAEKRRLPRYECCLTWRLNKFQPSHTSVDTLRLTLETLMTLTPTKSLECPPALIRKPLLSGREYGRSSSLLKVPVVPAL